MFFKQASVYRLSDDQKITHEQLVEAAEKFPHSLPENLDPKRYGFIAPFGQHLVETATGVTQIACKLSWRDLPSSVINDALHEKVKAIEEAESRPVGRTERKGLKDEIIFSLLPKAFIKHRITHAILVDDLIIVDAPPSQAEDLISKLREGLGSLRCYPVVSKTIPTQVMTYIVKTGADTGSIEVGEDCLLKSGKGSKAIRVKHVDLSSDEILNLINTGFYVESLSMGIKDHSTFQLDEAMRITKIKFDDVVAEKANDGNPETIYEQQIAEMLLMGGELRKLVTTVFGLFGGMQEYDSSDSHQNAPARIDDEDDSLYHDAIKTVKEAGRCSISHIQRTLRIGYNRAARMVERMEAEKIVSPSDNTGHRTVLAKQ